jgi:hypothetical protein
MLEKKKKEKGKPFSIGPKPINGINLIPSFKQLLIRSFNQCSLSLLSSFLKKDINLKLKFIKNKKIN